MRRSLHPPPLHPPAEVRILATSRSLARVPPTVALAAERRWVERGFVVTYGRHAALDGPYNTPPAALRADDLNEALADPAVAAIQCVIGGLLGNQMLPLVAFGALAAAPKWLIGHSDNTALINAAHQQTGVVCVHGPNFVNLGMEVGLGPAFDQLLALTAESWGVDKPMCGWSDDAWWDDQDNRTWHREPLLEVVRPGVSVGALVGGNLSTFALLAETGLRPSLAGSVFLIDDVSTGERNYNEILRRRLFQVFQWPDFAEVAGVLVARFPRSSGHDAAVLAQDLLDATGDAVPIVVNLDAGHTVPQLSLPIGGRVRLSAREPANVEIRPA